MKQRLAASDAHGRASFGLQNSAAPFASLLKTVAQRGSALLPARFTHAVSLAAALFGGLLPAFADAPVLTPPSSTTVLEDCSRTNLSFTITDADTPFFAVTVTATSSNTALVASTNVAVIGSGTTRTVGLTPTPNASGTSTITLVADDGSSRVTNNFVLTVTAVNDAPILGSLTNITILEDAAVVTRATAVIDVDTPIQFVTVSVRSSDTNVITAAISGSTTNRTLTLSPVTNAFGASTITLIANDGSRTATNFFNVTVTAVNDTPTLGALTALTVPEDAAATNRTVVVNDVDDPITNVTVTATSSNTNVATVSISGTSTNRTLTVTPVADAFGVSTVRLVASDGAKSLTNSFTFTVNSVNDVPSFNLSTNLVTVAEESGVFTLTNFVDSISSGPTNESTQTNLFLVTTTNTAFFATQPAISPAGTLTFRPGTNVNGTNTISVVIRDSGGTNNSGINLSAAQTFAVVVTPVNDAPVISGISAYSIREDVGTTNRTFVVGDIDTTISSVTLSAESSDTNLVNVAVSGTTTNRTLAVTTVADANGSATITLIADDGSATATNSFVLTVTPVNDAPSFTLSTNLITVTEDGSPFSLDDFATNMVSGPSDESSQTNFFVLTVTNTSFYAVQPAISPSGTLTFRPNTNVFGTNNIRVALRDSGGTNSGGINTSAVQTFRVVVSADNDAPVIGTIASFSINEDLGRTNRNFLLTDVDTVISNVVMTVTSSDTNVATVTVSGVTTNRTLAITTVTNAFGGPLTITLVADDGTSTATNTFSLTVNAINDAPKLVALTALSILEDSAPTNRTVTVTDVDDEITNVIVTATSANTNIATVSVSGTDTNRTLTITPVTNAFGTSTITITADDGAKTATNSFVLTVLAVNDVPSFTLSTNAVTAGEDGGAFSLTGFATSISAGPSNESTQTNLFIVTTTNSAFFATQPAVSPAGVLTFRPATNVFGTNTLSVVLRDSGGTTNGGVNTSAAQTFDVIVSSVDDSPVLSGLAAFTIKEDSSTNRTFVVRDTDTEISTVTVTATSSDTNLVSLSTSGTTTNRTLTVTALTNLNGTATITLVADDGNSTSTNSFVLTVSAVNDAPTFTLTTNVITVLEDSGAYSLSDFATNIVVGPSDESAQTNFFVLTVTNATFYAAQPAISPTGTLTFRPNTNVFGTNNITVVLRDSGGTNSSGVNVSAAQTFRVVVSSTNDAPVISTIANFSINEDAGRTNKTFLVTDVDTVISNVVLTVTSSDTNIVTATVTGSTTNRTLSITTVTNASGSATITLVASDSIDTSTNSFTLTVNALNDAPTLVALTALSILEDSGATNRTVVLDDVDTDVTNVTVTASSSATNVATVAITGTTTNRTLTISPSTNGFGTSTITLVAHDGAKSATNSFVLTVLAVNDVPAFTLSTNVVTVAEDNGLYTGPAFATGISAGPSNESTQTNLFILTPASTNFFATQPSITAAGTLTFKPATNIVGTNTISVVLRDSGGTTNGGVNTSAAQTFDIVVSAVNDAPIISGISAFTINEDLGTTNKTFVLADVDTDISTVTVTATSSDTNLVTVSTSGTTTNRTLAVTTVTNAFGAATITLVADDGSDTSTNSFVLTVNSVNDAPSFTLTTNNVTVTKYSYIMSVTNFATSMVAGPSNESTQTWSFVVTAGNTNSFVVQPSISTNGTLTFRAKDLAGVATVSVRLQDNGGNAAGGTNTSPVQTFTVTVPPNPYIPLKGEYNGLFYETNGVLNASAGFVNFSLATNGTYTGFVLLVGSSNSFSGQFDLAGDSVATVTRTNTDLTMTLAIDLSTNFTETISGTVSDGSWTSELLADHATFKAGFNPAPYEGEYNVVLPGSATPATLPGGAGIATASLNANGIVTLSGELGDSTEISQSVSISKDGVWPLYVPLYDGKGLLLSWVTFAWGATNDLSGDATWIKESSVGGTYYSGGFTNDLVVTGSYYMEPPLGLAVLDLNSASVIINGGNLSSPITNSVTLNWDSTVTIDPSATNGLTFTFNLVDGTFSGQFTDPASSQTREFNGVVLQTSTNAVGYFLGTSQSGSVILK